MLNSYIIRRIASAFGVMIMVGVFVFLLLRLAPGDPADFIAGPNAPQQMVESIRQGMGLNEPMPIQFMKWVDNMAHGDFGTSIFAGRPVLELLSHRLEPTLSLALLTIVLAVLLGVSFGILAAWRTGGFIDRTLTVFSALGFSIPIFVLGYVLVYFFAIRAQLLPVQGYSPLAQGVKPWFVQLVLPTIALSAHYIAYFARITRASMLEVLSEDYMRTAAAKGASPASMLFHHALKNCGVPILTVIGMSFAYLVGGVVVTETVFNLPGIGRLVVDAINSRDYPVIQTVLILVSALYVLINLAVDMVYTFIDPRIQY